ncbi:MAG: ABC transporter ATP-binding protein [Deltaproteobacteria bacterium]|nr:MAG: ABC transporter ATP-binding protein [Deltaproteobacteria bacterium]
MNDGGKGGTGNPLHSDLPLLVLEGVWKTFLHHGNRIEVLRGIDLSVYAGQCLAVVGASGVGKSTLLDVMGSLEPPTRGVVRFGGRNVYGMDDAALCRLRNREIGFVFQFHHLLPEFNALENVMMPALIARRPRRDASEAARDVLKKVGLDHRLNHRAGELSGGEQQRVALARAMVMRPRLILADEPTGNLDRLTGQGIVDLLLRINREEGVTLVIATHNQRLAGKMSRELEIVDGRILETGT